MSLNRGQVNPLSVIKIRKLDFIPDHFSRINIRKSESDIKILDQWINYHLNSRYAIRKTFVLDSDNKLTEALEIGMEDPIEITMFSIGCPYIHKT